MKEEFIRYLRLKELSELSVENYLYQYRKLRRIGEVNQENVETYLLDNQHPISFAMVKHLIDCFKLNIKIPKKKKRNSEIMSDLGGYISMDDIDKILENTKYERDYMLFFVMFRCGRRISEMLNLKVNDINFEKGTILFNILKKRREFKRYKAVDSEVIYKLKQYIQKNDLSDEDYLFARLKGKLPMSRQNAHIIFRKAAEAAGITRVGYKKPHTHHLRHSHAINFLSNSNHPGGLKLLQRQLEHSDIKATSVYLQFSQEDQRKELEKAFVKRNKYD